MLMVTTGGWESHYGPRGINGPIDELLFPIHHGIFYYPGFDVLPPFVAWHVPYISDEARQEFLVDYGQRLQQLSDDRPLVFPRLAQFDEQLYPLTTNA